MPDLSDEITDAAGSPRKVKTDVAEVEAQPIPDLIAADQYLANKNAGSGASPLKTAMRFGRCIPPGAV